MITKKNVLIFFAGAEFFHTLSHLILFRFTNLPVKVDGTIFTHALNAWAILINGAITVGLLYWASKTKR